MKRKWIILSGIATLAAFITADIHANEVSEKAALTSAAAWLALSDAGKYPETWDQAATYFKDRLTKDQWIASLKGGRTPLGKVLSRKLKSKLYTASMLD